MVRISLRQVLIGMAGLVVALVGFTVPSIADAAAPAANSSVRLNEVQTANNSTLTDQSGASPDWIELYNASASAVNLGGWALSDNAATPSKWVFPAGTSIGGGSTLVVFASGTGTNVGSELHTNFKLASSGEYLGLFNSAGALVSSFDPIPAVAADFSWGVSSSGVLNIFDAPTPGGANGTGSLGFLADVEVSPERGFFDNPVQVTLTSEPGSEIRYTTDGSEPSPGVGTLYTSPITISSTAVLRSVAVRAGWTSPKPVTNSYLFMDDVPNQSRMDNAIVSSDRASVTAGLESLPVISLTSVNPDNTSRYTWSQTDEAVTAVEMIFPDGTSGFQVDAGVKEIGGASVRFAKDSLRLKFSSEWGESSLEYPVFGTADNPSSPATDSFKRLTLRSGAHDSGFYSRAGVGVYRSHLRARWHDETMLDLGHTNTHGRFVNVFLNGQYWGQYHLREHLDDHFMASYLGGDNNDYVGVNRGEVSAGSGSSWDVLRSFAGNWGVFSQIVDPVNYVDFMLVSEYGGNAWDLKAYQNWRAAGPATIGPDAPGFVFVSSDPDTSLISTTTRTTFPGPNGTWTALLEEADPAFVSLVTERSQVLFSSGGVLSESVAAERWTRLADQIDQSIYAENARWAVDLPPATWNANMFWFENNFFPRRTTNVVRDLQGRIRHLGQDGVASQSSLGFGGEPSRAIDGDTNGVWSDQSVTHTAAQVEPWWQVDLGSTYDIDSLRLWNRHNYSHRLTNVHVFVSDVPFTSASVAGSQAQPGVTDVFVSGKVEGNKELAIGRSGRYVRVQLSGTANQYLSLAEVQIFGTSINGAPVVATPAQQSSVVGAEVSVPVSASDPNGDAVTWSAAGLPSGVAIDADTGTIDGVVREAGTFSVTVTATDSRGGSADAQFSWIAAFPTTSRMILNEWNAVAKDEVLKNGGADSALGTVVGNGGDWFELVVIEDHLDIRGWTLEISDDDNPDGIQEVTDEFTFANQAQLADLAAGTIITVSEDFADDLSFDPASDDWSINLQANSDDDGSFFTDSQSNFNVNNENWQLVVRDAAGNPVFGPAGEGVGASGVGDNEVGELEADPTGDITPVGAYDDGSDSTFGEPNGFDGRLQDFSAIRSGLADNIGADSTVSSPAVGATLANPAVVITGSASDNVGVAGVRVAVRNRDTGQWLRADGSFGAFQFVSAVLDAPGAATTGWSYSAALQDGRWFVVTRAEDVSGNRNGSRGLSRFEVDGAASSDTTEPDSVILLPAHRSTVSASALSVIGTSSDNVEVARVRVTVQNLRTKQWRQTDGTFATSYSASDAELNDPGATSTSWVLLAAGLSPDNYAITVRAIDGAGNADSSRARVRITIN